MFIEVSIGLAGCGAGMAGLMNRSLGRRCGGAGGLLEPTGCRAAETQAGLTSCPQEWHLGGPTIRESLGDGACIDDRPEKPQNGHWNGLLNMVPYFLNYGVILEPKILKRD